MALTFWHILELWEKSLTNIFRAQKHIFKFHQLWEAGVTAHLDLDTHAGEAWVGLRAQLGRVPGPLQSTNHGPPRRSHRNPAYYRRQERRKAAKTADAAVAASVEVTDSEPSAGKVNGDDFLNMILAETAEIGNSSDKNEISAVEAETYPCEICDFESNWTNGSKIHMSRR